MTASPAGLTPLSGLDALFLQLESAEMPMHVGSLSLLELPPGHRGDFTDRLRRLIGARLHLAEAFSRRLVTMPLGLANPAWMRSDDIDLDHHIRRVTLPRPGTLAQLEACVARLHARRLDRSRPLWELVIIDGLGGRLAGHVGYYAKVHHAAIDGQAGVALAQAMLDPTPTPRAVAPPPARAPAEVPGTLDRLRVAATQTTRQLRALAGLLPVAAGTIGDMLRAQAGPAPAPTGPARPGDAAPLLAPRSPLGVTISEERAFTTAALPLAQVRDVARALEVSLNDVVLATCSGALRRWLAHHGGVPRRPLGAGVPFSIRVKGDASASNKVSMMRAGLATHLADPARRLAAIHASTSRGKAVTGSLRALVPTDYPSLGAAWIVGGIGWLAGAVGHRLPAGTPLPTLAPVAISNVPGPPQTLYVAGARVVHYWPASIVVHGVALNITVQSYADWLDIGLVACRRAVPDLATFKRHLAESFAELRALAARAATRPGTARRHTRTGDVAAHGFGDASPSDGATARSSTRPPAAARQPAAPRRAQPASTPPAGRAAAKARGDVRRAKAAPGATDTARRRPSATNAPRASARRGRAASVSSSPAARRSPRRRS